MTREKGVVPKAEAGGVPPRAPAQAGTASPGRVMPAPLARA
jgi:hypothetical protein